jgi:hypothetical protein
MGRIYPAGKEDRLLFEMRENIKKIQSPGASSNIARAAAEA